RSVREVDGCAPIGRAAHVREGWPRFRNAKTEPPYGSLDRQVCRLAAVTRLVETVTIKTWADFGSSSPGSRTPEQILLARSTHSPVTAAIRTWLTSSGSPRGRPHRSRLRRNIHPERQAETELVFDHNLVALVN